MGGGYGGGDGYNGPRDWTSSQYAPHSQCIDTSKPVNVAASFPVDLHGNLLAMEVTISQEGHNCSVTTKTFDYKGMLELSLALAAGMTPVVSYWSSDQMLWMDGQGTDGKGPCKNDNAAACPASVQFSRFAVTPIGEAGLSSQQQAQSGSSSAPATTTTKLYWTGQEDEAQAGSDESLGAFELLNEAADLILTAAKTKSKFDCSAGFEEWELGWSRLKKAHCCHEVSIPCPVPESLPVPQSSMVPATARTTTPAAQIEPSQGQAMCAASYQQCGGRGWSGASCCSSGCSCKSYSDYYSQCTPDIPGGACAAPAAAETAIFMVKDSIGDAKTLRGQAEARVSTVLRGWVLVSTCAMAFLMITLAAVAVRRRLTAQVRPDEEEGAASAGDSDPELAATPQQFFRPTTRTADGNHESPESLDTDLPLCEERLFQRSPMGQEGMPAAFMPQSLHGASHLC